MSDACQMAVIKWLVDSWWGREGESWAELNHASGEHQIICCEPHKHWHQSCYSCPQSYTSLFNAPHIGSWLSGYSGNGHKANETNKHCVATAVEKHGHTECPRRLHQWLPGPVGGIRDSVNWRHMWVGGWGVVCLTDNNASAVHAPAADQLG